MKTHRFKRVVKGGSKGRKGQTKMVRVGARNPGQPKGKGMHGSIRNPY